MIINFSKLILHNFMCFADAEIDLTNNGYVLVKGVNNNTNDCAQSNGSGKSTIWDALSWVLTGETIRKGSKDIRNLFNKESDGAWVEVNFTVDSNRYKVIRSKESKQYKNQLLIYVNDLDKSGKGIRDSEKILSELLPELSAELLGSVIIFGQGLPNKFTNNTPSGRKELLEQLSKSDFMIEDLKNRVKQRKAFLNQEIIKNTAAINELNGMKKVANTELASINRALQELNLFNNESAENRLRELNDLLNGSNEKQITATNELDSLTQTQKELLTQRSEIIEKQNIQADIIRNSFDEKIKENFKQISEIQTKADALKAYITKISQIKDTCPTCGQKLKDVEKPSTSTEELELEKLNSDLKVLWTDKYSLENKLNTELSSNKQLYQTELCKIEGEDTEIQSKINSLKNILLNLTHDIKSCENEINDLVKKMNNYQNQFNFYTSKEAEISKNLTGYETDLLYYNNENSQLNNRLSIQNNFDKLLSREFRGYLLNGVINFINNQLQKYSQSLFKHSNIEFKLEGNDLNIIFSGKYYEDLSGGEKQKIDIITQLSLREMMVNLSNFSCNILVLDEITDNLDAMGCDAILNIISSELADLDSIYIISHKADSLNIPYDDELIITKNNEGISTIN